jgi:hypothetical protein
LRLGRRLGARRHIVRCRRGAVADDDDDLPDRDDLALAREDLRHGSGRGGGDLDCGLVRLDLDERVVLGHDLSLCDEPAGDLPLRQTLAQVGQLELVRHQDTLSASPG